MQTTKNMKFTGCDRIWKNKNKKKVIDQINRYQIKYQSGKI